MAKSFFERLTGSVRVDEGGSAAQVRPLLQPAPMARSRERKHAQSSTSSGESSPSPKAKVIHPSSPEEAPTDTRSLAEEPTEEGQLTVDIYDDGAMMVIQSTVAGVKPDDIDISLQEDTLTIRGSRKRAQEVTDDNFYYRELYWGTFSRSIILPEEVDFQKAQAVMKNGLLTIKLPKKDKGEKRIQVRAGD